MISKCSSPLTSHLPDAYLPIRREFTKSIHALCSAMRSHSLSSLSKNDKPSRQFQKLWCAASREKKLAVFGPRRSPGSAATGRASCPNVPDPLVLERVLALWGSLTLTLPCITLLFPRPPPSSQPKPRAMIQPTTHSAALPRLQAAVSGPIPSHPGGGLM